MSKPSKEFNKITSVLVSYLKDNEEELSRDEHMKLSKCLSDINDYVVLLESKGKHKKKEVDNTKPKKTATAYFIFMKDKRVEVNEKFPNLKITEVSSKLGELWRELGDKEKEEYKAKALKLRQEAQQEFEQSTGVEQEHTVVEEEAPPPVEEEKPKKTKKGKSKKTSSD
jgi:hypothetical protein